MCLYPKLIKNRKYTKTKKNGGIIPPIPDERVKKVPIGCQNCIECRKQKARGWQVRLLEDVKTHKNGTFVTLTFSNESYSKLDEEINPEIEGYERDNAIATLAVRRFLERWRKKYKVSVRHWLVTELGHRGTENIHLHGIIYSDNYMDIRDIWQYGFVWTGYNGKKSRVNASVVNYIVKYINKADEKHKCYKSIVLCSPGIGSGYTKTYNAKLNVFKGLETKETYRTESGHNISMPIYWRNKIYSEGDRERLWLNRLDKEERWVCGERICIKNGEEDYYKILEFHRKRNKRLGYGSDEKDWNREKYERERRKLVNAKRLQRLRPDG